MKSNNHTPMKNSEGETIITNAIDLSNSQTFDPILYFNTQFPDEESLKNLPQVIDDFTFEIKRLDKEILEGIHKHSVINKQLKQEINKISTVSSNVLKEIKNIKQKSIQSEQIVHDMCKDIKMLDLAKTNLNANLEIIDRYKKLLIQIDEFGEFCSNKDYEEARLVLKEINIGFRFFQSSKDLKQIKEVRQALDEIIIKVSNQIKQDFLLLSKGLCDLDSYIFLDSCYLAEEIGTKLRNEIMTMPAESMLNPYRTTYDDMYIPFSFFLFLIDFRDNNQITRVEQRYLWFVKEVREFKKKHLDKYPHEWGMISYIVQTFCQITRISIIQLLDQQ